MCLSVCLCLLVSFNTTRHAKEAVRGAEGIKVNNVNKGRCTLPCFPSFLARTVPHVLLQQQPTTTYNSQVGKEKQGNEKDKETKGRKAKRLGSQPITLMFVLSFPHTTPPSLHSFFSMCTITPRPRPNRPRSNHPFLQGLYWYSFISSSETAAGVRMPMSVKRREM
jgi:hypothetical protein